MPFDMPQAVYSNIEVKYRDRGYNGYATFAPDQMDMAQEFAEGKKRDGYKVSITVIL